MAGQVSVSGILEAAVSVVRDGIRPLALYVLVVGGLSAAGFVIGLAQPEELMLAMGTEFDVERAALGGLYQLLVMIISFIAGYLLLARFLDVNGRLGEGGTRIWAYVGLSILLGLGVLFGFVLLIVPGIILMVRWTTSSCFLLGERQSVTQSLGASWRATSGHSWPIFFSGLVLIIGLMVIGAVAGGLGLVVGSGAVVGAFAAFANALSGAMAMAFHVAVYTLVHDSTDEVREVFA